jgi:hypothetical protein
MRTLVGLLALCPTLLMAQQPLPAPAAAGLELLLKGDCIPAFTQWTSSWTSPPDSAKRQALVGSCDLFKQFGKLNGYDLVRIVPVTENLTRIYVVLRYDIEPVYLMLVAYRPAGEWRITTVNWNTNADRVLPSAFVPQETPKP